MSYRIGSLNCLRFGRFSEKDDRTIAEMIMDYRLDVIALQEVKHQEAAERILRWLPLSWRAFQDTRDTDAAGAYPEDYAFLWNTDSLTECSKDGHPHVFEQVKSNDFIRRPLYGRFRPTHGACNGGDNFEFRLINVHIYCGDNYKEDKERRKKEYRLLLNEVFSRVNRHGYQDTRVPYTLALGDYNVTMKWIQKEHVEDFDVITVQEELTTLKAKEPGFANDYDHFSYEPDRFEVVPIVSRPNAVQDYKDNDFPRYKDEVSDHVPVIIEVSFI